MAVLSLTTLSAIAITRSIYLLDPSAIDQFSADTSYVASQVTTVRGQLIRSVGGADLESARQAVSTLIVALIGISLLAIGIIAYLNIKLVRTKQELENENTSDDLREHFLTSAAHELNTPLTVAAALTDALVKNGDDNLTDRQLRQLEAIQRNNRHLQDMVDAMIQTTLAGETHGSTIESVQYSEFIVESLELIKADLDLRGIEIRWSVAQSSDHVSIDASQIRQVMSNLLLNAGQSSPEGAIVFVSTDRIGDEVVTCVRDFGPGIPAADQPYVFQPFFKIDSENNRGSRRAGFGLMLVKTIVESHGGTVKLEQNEKEQGATFCFSLPTTG
ncbi:MAG: HAMP domain-containing histidine kinase [Chloroflexi bacterium]|nr:HAMP domain-containing histidine kinase [Chloroflexota bacterium]